MFKLTKDTDPSTIMFEGHPDVTIPYVRPAPGGVYVYIGEHPPGTVFGTTVIARGNNHEHSPDGIDISGNWPRVVQRFTLDPAKPIGVRLIKPDRYSPSQDQLDGREYYVAHRKLPAVGDTPELLVIRSKDAGAAELEIDRATGRVLKGVSAGSNLQFFNKPVIELRTDYLAEMGTSVTVTLTDGVITDIKPE